MEYFRFLDLPPELRNRVYTIGLKDWNIETVNVRPKGNGYAFSEHPLHLVCKQFCKEFSGLLGKLSPETAKTIISEVHDFGLRAVMI